MVVSSVVPFAFVKVSVAPCDHKLRTIIHLNVVMRTSITRPLLPLGFFNHRCIIRHWHYLFPAHCSDRNSNMPSAKARHNRCTLFAGITPKGIVHVLSKGGKRVVFVFHSTSFT